MRVMGMRVLPDRQRMLVALLSVAASVAKLDRADLNANDVVGLVGINSLAISQILVEMEIQLGVEFDFDQLPKNLFELTLEELAEALAGSIVRRS
jgi:acyl carrier protein